MNATQINTAIDSATVLEIDGAPGLSAILNREFKYCSNKPTVSADGNPTITKEYHSDWLKRWDERVAVSYMADCLLKENAANENGTTRQFTPLIRPFHVDENGEVLTQLRMYLYAPKSREDAKMPQGFLVFRLEPAGFETKFDAESKYSTTAQVAAEETVEAEAQ